MKTARILCREDFGLGVLLLLLLTTSYVHQMDRQLLVRSTDGDAFNLKFRFRARRWHVLEVFDKETVSQPEDSDGPGQGYGCC